MAGFAKLFSDIVMSSIWGEDDKTRIVWVTLLATSDAQGYVSCAIPGLASASRVSIEDCRKAITKLMSPDPDSRTKDFEGRRIQEVDGGFFIINYLKYRERRDDDRRRQYMKEYMKKRRNKNVNLPLTSVSHSKPRLSQAEAEAEAEAEKKKKKRLAPPSLEEFLQYIKDKNLPINNPERLFAGYSDGGWTDTRGNPIKNWKLKLQTVAGYSEPKESETPKAVYPDGQSPRDLAIKKINDTKLEKINA